MAEEEMEEACVEREFDAFYFIFLLFSSFGG
jgi:hypothetical protein